MRVVRPNEQPFLPTPQQRRRCRETGFKWIEAVRAKYGTTLFSLLTWQEPDKSLDIGPVRRIYFQRLACLHVTQNWFPFGVYLPLFDIKLSRAYGKFPLDPYAWLEEDVYLTWLLQRLGVSWWPLEQAMLQAYWETAEQEGKADSRIIGIHIGSLARVDMFHRDPDKNEVRAAAELYEGLYDRAPSLLSTGRAWEFWSWKDSRQAFLLSHDLPPVLTNYTTFAKSPFVTPVVKATVRTLWQKMDTKKDNSQLPVALRHVLSARLDFDPRTETSNFGILRNEFWQLVADILNHVANVVFGIRLPGPDPLTAEAVQKRCGGSNTKIAWMLRY